MTEPIILVAASGLARETLDAVRAQGRYEVIGFADDDQSRWGQLYDGVKVLGGLDVVSDHRDAAVLICAGRGAARESIATRLQLDAPRYATVVHPSATVGGTCTISPGSIVLAGCALTASVSVGRHVVAMPKVSMTHDDVVDDFATLCAGVTLGGFVRVGARSYIGMSASVREHRLVGADAVIGMGAVVVTDVPDGETWVGVPARLAHA